MTDAYRYAASIFSRVVSDGYIGMVRTIPQLYGIMYDRAESVEVARGFRVWAAEFTARNLRRRIERLRPTAVVCTHAFSCNAMDAYKRLIDPRLPVIGIVTDYVVHPFWIYRSIDAYAVASPEIRATMIARGVDPARIHVDGIPVDARFGAETDRALLRRRLDLPEGKPVVLVMGGGLGLGRVANTVRALGRIERPMTLVVLVGKNASLGRRIDERARREGLDVRVVGFTEDVYDWMRAADVLVTKPGGLSTTEALAARTPLVLTRPLPGQEERNARYLVSRGAAMHAERSRDVARVVDSLLGDAALRDALVHGADALRRPAAAETIAERVTALGGR